MNILHLRPSSCSLLVKEQIKSCRMCYYHLHSLSPYYVCVRYRVRRFIYTIPSDPHNSPIRQMKLLCSLINEATELYRD